MIRRLRDELRKLECLPADWRAAEILTNVFLLSCAVSSTTDDYLTGTSYDFSKLARAGPPARLAVAAIHRLLRARRSLRDLRLRRLRVWRDDWEEGVDRYLRIFVAGVPVEPAALSKAAAQLSSQLDVRLPVDLLQERLRVPAAFRSQDLTHLDVLALGNRWLAQHPDRERPVLVLGLRSAGSYFAPLVRALLGRGGFRDVESVTVRPKGSLGSREKAQIARSRGKGAHVVIVDEPVNTGGTLARAVGLLEDSGFQAVDLTVLVPVHPHGRDGTTRTDLLGLSGVRFLGLEPDEWHKCQLRSPRSVAGRVCEYLQGRGYRRVDVVPSKRADELNAWLADISEQKFHSRLKQVYELNLETQAGNVETRYVLAKSVGWGWLGYHAFLAGDALADFVPPLLGLRDGLLFTEWVPQAEPGAAATASPERMGAYIAARARALGLPDDPTSDLGRQGRHPGFEELTEALLAAYSLRPLRALKRARLRRDLAHSSCPVPALIDGKMRRIDWIEADGRALKSDFEQHGLGKTELNVTDPAFDIAQAALSFGLDEQQEARLVAEYARAAGDAGAEERLFLTKMIAGITSINNAIMNLEDAHLARRRQEFHRQYLEAWNFLILHTTRFAATFCKPPRSPSWGRGAVVLDVDGVLDQMVFGYPSTTVAGIRAMSLLHAHARPVALNTARTLREVRDYSRAYGLVGGAAEYGSCVWDAVADRKRVLVSDEALRELELLRNALRELPGVFLNDDYEHSLRVYTYENRRTAPLPALVLQNQIGMLGLKRLRTHQTYLDTAVVAREADKGAGLVALLELAGQDAADVAAIGDSSPDLPMFRVAARSFAPGHISCGAAARALGCRIARNPYQAGFVESVRSLLHPDGDSCDACRSVEGAVAGNDLILRLLATADEGRLRQAFRALFDPGVLEIFKT